MRRLRVVVLVAMAAVLLSGCFRYQSSVAVGDDGSGRVQESLLVNRTVLEAMFDSPAAVEAHLPRADAFPLPDWVTGRNHREGVYQGVVFDLTFDDPEQLNERLNTLHRLIARVTGSRATSTVELAETSGGWTFTMQTADLAEVPELPGSTARGYDALYREGELLVALRLPGRIVDHNADAVVDGQLVWRPSAHSVQTQFFARSSTGTLSGTVRSNRTLQLATALATAGGLAVFAVIGLTRRRGGSDPMPPSLHLGEARRDDPGPPQQWPLLPPQGPPTGPAGGGPVPPRTEDAPSGR